MKKIPVDVEIVAAYIGYNFEQFVKLYRYNMADEQLSIKAFDSPNRAEQRTAGRAIQETNPCVQTRRAVPRDAFSIASILYRAFIEYKSSYTTEAFAATILTPRRILDRINEGSPVWVALKNGMVVGTVSAVTHEKGLYVRSMAVDPEARRSGIGHVLLERAEEFAAEHGCVRLFLSTTPFLKHAIRLYERCGFRRTDGGPGELAGTPLFTMEKILRRSDQERKPQ